MPKLDVQGGQLGLNSPNGFVISKDTWRQFCWSPYPEAEESDHCGLMKGKVADSGTWSGAYTKGELVKFQLNSFRYCPESDVSR